MPDLKSEIMKFKAKARDKQMANRSLLDSAFPSPAQPQPSHLGSQSIMPSKQDSQMDPSNPVTVGDY